jgi:hypothetical protein
MHADCSAVLQQTGFIHLRDDLTALPCALIVQDFAKAFSTLLENGVPFPEGGAAAA